MESPFDDAEAIAKAIGPASKVVVTVGAAEKGPTAEVTANEALEVVRAAKLAGVGHVAVVYNAAPVGFPVQSTGNVLDGITSFFSNLFAQGQSLTLGGLLRKMAELDVSYTLIKAALTDDYAAKSSYALAVAEEGKASGATTVEFKVSRLQIAGLVADVLSNTAIAENKVRNLPCFRVGSGGRRESVRLFFSFSFFFAMFSSLSLFLFLTIKNFLQYCHFFFS